MKKSLVIIPLSASLLFACQENNKSATNKTVDTTQTTVPNKEVNQNYAVSIPSNIPEQERHIYAVRNYWSGFDINNADQTISSGHGEQAVVDFINLFSFNKIDDIKEGIKTLLEKTKEQPELATFFITQLDRYLYDSNSPFYNDLYYEVFIRELLNSNLLDQNKKILYETRLKLVSKNQQGTKATNFTFETSTQKKSLYEIPANYLMVLFYEPGCPSCEKAIKTLKESKEFNQLITSKSLDVLAIYPDGNKEIWINYQNNIPANWTNGLDVNATITKSGLYDLKASPTIYLLDKDKKVILKDTQLEQVFQYFNL